MPAVLIHIVGVEKEIDMLPVFMELGMLLQNTKFTLVFIGPEISKKAHLKQYNCGNVSMLVHKGHYENFLQKNRDPDLIVGFNAGLSAYHSWSKALVILTDKKIPAYFTDYCHYSSVCSKAPMEGLKLGTISEPIVNPFRSPVRLFSEENRMSWYSNAFIFHLEYYEIVDRNYWTLLELSWKMNKTLELECENLEQNVEESSVSKNSKAWRSPEHCLICNPFEKVSTQRLY